MTSHVEESRVFSFIRRHVVLIVIGVCILFMACPIYGQDPKVVAITPDKIEGKPGEMLQLVAVTLPIVLPQGYKINWDFFGDPYGKASVFVTSEDGSVSDGDSVFPKGVYKGGVAIFTEEKHITLICAQLWYNDAVRVGRAFCTQGRSR